MKESLAKNPMDQISWQNMALREEASSALTRNDEYMHEFRDSLVNFNIFGDEKIV